MTRLSLALAVLAGSFAFVAIPASANHSWGNYHWARSSNPVNLTLVDSVTSNWDGYLDTARGDWDASNVLALSEQQGSEGRDRRQCKPISGKIRVCNYTYGNNGWLGLAQIWVSGDHITQAFTKVNDTYFNTSAYSSAAWHRLVMCQEVGHDFGLDHQDETFDNPNLGTCMDYTNDPDGGAGGAVNNDPSNEHPNTHDYQQLQTIYGSHLDSFVTPNALPTQASGTAERVRDGLYVQNLGNGQTVFTWILWTDPKAAHGPPFGDE